MVEVTIADGEVVLWPKRVALVGYPIFKQFEAQKTQGAKKQLVNAFLLLSSRYCGLLSWIIYGVVSASFQGTCFIDGVELKSFKDLPLVADHLLDSPEHNLQRALPEWNLDCAKCKKIFDFASSVNVLIKLIKVRCFDYIASQLLLSLHQGASRVAGFHRNQAFTQCARNMSLDKVGMLISCAFTFFLLCAIWSHLLEYELMRCSATLMPRACSLRSFASHTSWSGWKMHCIINSS